MDPFNAVQGKGYVVSDSRISVLSDATENTLFFSDDIYPDGINKSEILSKKYKTVNVSKRFYTLSSQA